MKELIKTIEQELNDSLILTTTNRKDVIIVTGLTNTTYTFLQNLTRLKAKLYKHGYTFKPIQNLADQIIIVQIVKR